MVLPEYVPVSDDMKALIRTGLGGMLVFWYVLLVTVYMEIQKA